MPTKETSEQRKIRLDAEGRWDAFCARRAELEAEGKSRKEADIQATAEFQPVNAESNDEGFDTGEIDAALFEEKPKLNLRASMEWVYRNVMVKGLRPDDAPDPGAWALLHEVKTNPQTRSEFYKNIITKLLPNRAQIEREDMTADDGAETLKLIAEIEAISRESFAVEKSDPN